VSHGCTGASGLDESLFERMHLVRDEEAYALRHLKEDVNANLEESGERFHLNEKAVSGVLKTFGFLHRKRTNSGWVVLIDRAARKRIHELLSDSSNCSRVPAAIKKAATVSN
jgi:ribosomal protein L34